MSSVLSYNMKAPAPPPPETITVRYLPSHSLKELIFIFFQQSGLEKTSQDLF